MQNILIRRSIDGAREYQDCPSWVRISGNNQAIPSMKNTDQEKATPVKKVLIYTDKFSQEFESAKECAEVFGIRPGSVRENIRLGKKLKYKYYVKYI